MSSSSPSARPRSTLGPRPTRDSRRRSTSSCGTPAAETSAATVSGKSMTRHHSGSIPVVVDVPLRIERAAYADGSAGFAVIGESDPGGQGTGIRLRPRAPAESSEPASLRRQRRLRANASCRATCGGSPRGPATLKSGFSKSLRILLSPDCSSSLVIVVGLGQVDGIEFQAQLLVGGLARPVRRKPPAAGRVLMTPNHSGGSATFARPLGHLE